MTIPSNSIVRVTFRGAFKGRTTMATTATTTSSSWARKIVSLSPLLLQSNPIYCSSRTYSSLARPTTTHQKWPTTTRRSQQRPVTTTTLANQDSRATKGATTGPTTPIPIPTPIRQQHKFPSTIRTGTVVSAGYMSKTVKVQHMEAEWDPHIRKYYKKKAMYKVSDPHDSCREGDIIEFSSGYRVSRTVRHVVERITVPFGLPILERNPVMTPEEREEWWKGDKSAKGTKEYIGKIKKLVLRRTTGGTLS